MIYIFHSPFLMSLFLFFPPFHKGKSCLTDHILLTVRRCQEEEAVAVSHLGGKAPNKEGKEKAVGRKSRTDGKAVGFGTPFQAMELFHMNHVHCQKIIGKLFSRLPSRLIHRLKEYFIHSTFQLQEAHIKGQHPSACLPGMAPGEEHAAEEFIGLLPFEGGSQSHGAGSIGLPW